MGGWGGGGTDTPVNLGMYHEIRKNVVLCFLVTLWKFEALPLACVLVWDMLQGCLDHLMDRGM